MSKEFTSSSADQGSSSWSLTDRIPEVVSLHTIPRSEKPTEALSVLKEQTINHEIGRAVLAQASAAGETVLLARVVVPEQSAKGKTKIFVGGASIVGKEKMGEDRVVNVPPGAKGKEVAPEELQSDFGKFGTWRRLKGEFFADEDSKEDSKSHFIGLDESFLRGYNGPYAWVVRARPVPVEEIEERAATVDRKYRQGKPAADTKASSAMELDKLKQQYHELIKARKGRGLWEVDVFVGSKDAEDIDKVSGGLSAAADTLRQPYIFRKDEDTYASLDDALSDTSKEGFQASTSLVTSLFPLPAKEVEGITLSWRPAYAVNIPAINSLPRDQIVETGTVYDNNDFKAGSLAVPTKGLVKHELVSGTTRIGKSANTKEMGVELARQGIPVVYFDPKGEDYSVMGDILKSAEGISEKHRKVHIIQPGELDHVAVGYNPMQPEPGFSYEEHISLIHPVIVNAFGQAGKEDEGNQEATARYMSSGILGRRDKNFKGVYENLGRDIVTGQSFFPDGDIRDPELVDVAVNVEKAALLQRYQGEGANLSKFLKQRLASLSEGVTGQFFEGKEISTKELLSGNTVIDLSRVKDPVGRALIMGTTLVRMYEHLIVQSRKSNEGGQKPLRLFMVFEEANELVKEGPVAEQIADIVRKIGVEGVGIRFVTQTPSEIHSGILSNTGNKYSGRLLQDADQKVALGTVLSEDQRRHLATLKEGQIVFHSAGMDEPVFGITHDPTDLPKRKDQVETPDNLAKRQEGETLYTRFETHEAKKVLETKEGKVMRGWAHVLVYSLLKGYGDIEPDKLYGEFDTFWQMKFDTIQRNVLGRVEEMSEKRLQAMIASELGDEVVPDDEVKITAAEIMVTHIRDCAVKLAVTEAVNSRATRVRDRERTIATLSDRVAAHMEDETLPEWINPDLILKDERYMPIFMKLHAIYSDLREQVGPHKESAELVASLDVPEEFVSKKSVDQIKFLESRIAGYQAAIKAAGQNQEESNETVSAEQTETELESMEQRLKLTGTEVLKARKQAEEVVLEIISESLSASVSKKMSQMPPHPDTAQWKELYGPKHKIEGKNLLEQYMNTKSLDHSSSHSISAMETLLLPKDVYGNYLLDSIVGIDLETAVRSGLSKEWLDDGLQGCIMQRLNMDKFTRGMIHKDYHDLLQQAEVSLVQEDAENE